MTKVSIKAKPTFTDTVSISRPAEEPLKLKLIFKHRRKSELKEFIETSKDREELDVAMDIVHGWVDVEEEFSRDALAGLLEDFHNASDDIANAYIKALMEARRGN